MTTVLFLAEWALRSSVLVLSGASLLWLLRLKDPSTRLAAWTAILAGSLAIPVLTAILPTMALRIPQRGTTIMAAPVELSQPSALPVAAATNSAPITAVTIKPFRWADAALAVYGGVAFLLLLRLAVGLRASSRLRRASRATGRSTEGIAIYETELVAAPVTLGILDPAIVLPADWREWEAGRLEAVLAHERSHVRRHDPAIQIISMVHRVLLWCSPLSWFLHTRIVRTAEEASDDAAIAAIRDRVFYAEVLLDFTRKGVRKAQWLGVPMARYDRPDERIHRVLDGAALSRGITRWTVATILAIGSPLVYAVSAAQPQDAAAQAATPQPAPVRSTQSADAVQPGAPPVQPQREANYLSAMGNAVPSATVTVTSRVEGLLQSVNFKEGDTVQAGQLLATVDPTSYQMQLQEAEEQLLAIRDQIAAAQAALARDNQLAAQNMVPKTEVDQQAAKVQQLQLQAQSLQHSVEAAKLHMTYTKIVAPISGVVGFRLLDPGNMVHPGDASPIVIINQLQPMMVVFSIPAESLPRLRALHAAGTSLPVEVRTREGATLLDKGHIIAVDNQVDAQTGRVKLKAEFDNKNRELLPNQFVNVRVLLPQ